MGLVRNRQMGGILMLSKLKGKVGLCQCKNCLRVATVTMEIPIINKEFNICDKHLMVITKDATIKNVI